MGVLAPQRVPEALEKRLVTCAKEMGIPLRCIDAGWKGVFTETGALWRHGFQAVCITAMRKDDRFLPEWHRLSDVADRLQPSTLDLTHKLAWALLQDYDVG